MDWIIVFRVSVYVLLISVVLYKILSLTLKIHYSVIINKIIMEAARMKTTYKMKQADVYINGCGKIRPEVQNKIYKQAEKYSEIYRNESVYIANYFYKNGLIDNHGKTRKIKLFKLAAALWDYDDFGREECLSNLRADAETLGLPPEQFLNLRKQVQGDVVGVYIIYNITKRKYYVGQAKKLYFRVWQHFTGHGNGDVYADYKYGDKFVIRLLTLQASGYQDLDMLERDMIRQYNAFTTGYNKTIGNGYPNKQQWTGTNRTYA